MLISVGIHCTPATLTFLLPLKHTRHSTSGLWTWRPFACNAIPSRQPAGTVPHLHGSIQVLHLYFKEAFLAPLPKLLPKLFPIVCVSLSCFFPLALTYFYIYIYIYTHTHTHTHTQMELPRWHSGKEFTCQCKRHRFNPWVGKIPWRRKWQPTPVYLPGKFHGQRSLVGYSQT